MSLYNHIPINFKQSELIEKDNAHFYQTPTGEIYPSITTILHETMANEKKKVYKIGRNKKLLQTILLKKQQP